MAIDRKPLALAWLARVHRELKPNVTLDVFINSLRMNSYGDDVISDSDFQEWIQSKGEIINLSATVADNVRNAIVVKYASNKNWIPTRKTIDSAFLNLATTGWSYFDAVKVTSLEVLKLGKVVADATGQLTYAAAQSGTILLGVTKYIWYPLGAFVLYALYANRDKLSAALGDKAVKKLNNPYKYKRKKKSKK